MDTDNENVANNQVGALQEELNHKKKFEKGTLVLPFIVILLAVYYFSPFSVYLWNSSLYSIFHFFYFSFYIIPKDFFVSAAGPSGAFPNPFTITFAIFLSLAPTYLLSRGLYYIASKVGIRPKLVFSLVVFALLMAIVGIAGGNIEQNKCIEKMSRSENEYLKKTGVISFGIDESAENSPFLIKKVSSILYNTLDLKYLSGSPGLGRIIVQVEPDHEFEKMCKLSYYNQVSFAVAPTEKELFGVHFSEYWKYIKSSFCDSNQIRAHSKEDCLSHISSAMPLSIRTNDIKVNNTNKSSLEDEFISIDGSGKYSFSSASKVENSSGIQRIDYNIFNQSNGAMVTGLYIYNQNVKSTTNELYDNFISEKKYNYPGEIGIRLKNTTYEKIKLGDYVYVKRIDSQGVDYIMRFDKYEIGVHIDPSKQVNIQDFEKMLSTLRLKII